MDRIMRKAIILSIALLLSGSAIAQRWQPTFEIGLRAETVAFGSPPSFSRYLSQHLEYSAGDHGCFLKVSLFYFRVSAKGEIDSIYTRGNKNEQAAAIIQKNILATKGKWKMPENTNLSDKCWFIFPFIDPGRPNSCSEIQRISYHSLCEWLNLYVGGDSTKDQLGRVLLPPNFFPGFDQK